jgi:hypothetical protein
MDGQVSVTKVKFIMHRVPHGDGGAPSGFAVGGSRVRQFKTRFAVVVQGGLLPRRPGILAECECVLALFPQAHLLTCFA